MADFVHRAPPPLTVGRESEQRGGQLDPVISN